MSDPNDGGPCEVPLIEQLRDIPADYRTVRAFQWSDDGRETGHQFIPVGFMMHRAAAELESQAAEIERLKGDAERASALLNNVYVVNCRIQCDDVEDVNWFDARDRLINAAKGKS